MKNKTNQEWPLSFGNRTVISITLHSCCAKYFQNTDFTDDKPRSSRSNMRKANEFSVFRWKNVKLLLPKQMQSILPTISWWKGGHLILNDAKKDGPTSLSHSTEILRKSHIGSNKKPFSLELLYPDSDNSWQHVLREDEKQGYYILYFLLLHLEKLSILKLRDFLMWIWFKCDS